MRKANGLVPLVQLAFDAESACDTDAYAASQGALKNLVDRNDENLKDVCQAGGLSILTQVRPHLGQRNPSIKAVEALSCGISSARK